MKKLFVSVAVVSMMAAVPAVAQDWSSPSVYGTVGYTGLDLEDADVGAITGRLGAKFTPYFGVEGEASFGVKDDEFNAGGVPVTVEHDFDAAVYAVGTVPVSPNLEFFGRVGYGTTELTVEAAGLSDSERAESWNYGVGANYFFDAQNGVRADWTRRDFEDDAGEVDAYSLNYVRRF